MDTSTLEINIKDILTILGDSKRPIIEGEAGLLAEHILLCDFKFRYHNNINLLAYVIQFFKIHGEPHEVNIELSITKNAKIILCKCSCPAGLRGKCKHIFATLLHVNSQDVSDPEAARTLDHQVHGDDLFGRGDNVKEAVSRRNKLMHLLSSAGMELVKWSANEILLLHGVATCDSEEMHLTDIDAKRDHKKKYTVGCIKVIRSTEIAHSSDHNNENNCARSLD
ncbi:hypothetical protein TKK_0013297 [Trichogramma kaykai]